MKITIYENTPLCRLKWGEQTARSGRTIVLCSAVYSLNVSVCQLLSLCPDPVTTWIRMIFAYVTCLN